MDINNFNDYLKKRFGHKVYKISLNAGMTCPNRDGTLDTRGCIFCSAGGSGDFAQSPSISITEQIEKGKALVSRKIKPDGNGANYIAYFQAYTNTYAPVERLRQIYTEAALNDDVAAISIATRPDCIDEAVVNLLFEINNIKPVFIELGLQTSNEDVASYIRRGYSNSVFERAVNLIDSINSTIGHKDRQIHIVAHVIIGLPHESYTDMENTVEYINNLPIHGVKLQLLHVLKNTDLAKAFEKNEFQVLSMEEYADILIRLLLHIRPDIVIHRMTGDGPKNILIAPLWSGNKRNVLNYINKRLSEIKSPQGSLYIQNKSEE